MGDQPELQEGSEGEWVSHLQQLLEAAGYSPGAIDGKFGPKTEAAVKAYQEAFELTVDGIVGPQTWGQLTWTWDWSEFPFLGELLRTNGDARALLTAYGVEWDEDESIA